MLSFGCDSLNVFGRIHVPNRVVDKRMGPVEGFCFSLDLFCNTVNEGEWGTEVPSMVGSDGVTTAALVGTTGAEDITATSRTSTIMFVMLLLPSTGVALALKKSLGDNVITAGRLRGGEGMEASKLDACHACLCAGKKDKTTP